MTRISVVTVCFNSARTIAQTLESVANQSRVDHEHIIVDGGSTDETMAIVAKMGSRVSRAISEPDEGIYDAMNKGLNLATGDVVAFLNSDDRYADSDVLADVIAAIDSDTDFVYGDLQMINAQGQVVRHWKTGRIPAAGLTGTQIPHPSLFVRRELLNRITPAFDPSYRISADLKQQLIFINKLRSRGAYVPRPLVVMRLGGESTASLSRHVAGWRETARAYSEVLGGPGWWFTAKKVTSKLSSLRRLA